MKKTSIFNIVNIFLVVIYFAIILLQYNLNIIKPISLNNLWFALLCVFVGLSMLIKSILFKSDSALWLFISLTLVGFSVILLNTYSFQLSEFWPSAFSILAISSLVVGLVFKEIYQIKLFFTLSFVSIPLFLFTFDIINALWLVIGLLIAVFLSAYMYYLLPERWYSKKNTRKK